MKITNISNPRFGDEYIGKNMQGTVKKSTSRASRLRDSRGALLPKLAIIGLALIAVCMGSRAQNSDTQYINVARDLKKLGLSQTNLEPSKTRNAGPIIQTAINYLANNGGGTVLLNRGIYRASALKIPDSVALLGAGKSNTTIRAWDTKGMVTLEGGGLGHLTLLGTPTEEQSGENWLIKTKTRKGTAVAGHLITVDNGKNVKIDHVVAKESRYDPIYIRNCENLRVSNSEFDRAGRNILSIVGTTRDFIFSNCSFGSTWGLYHVDIEPNEGKSVQNGVFTECVFDGSNAGKDGADKWGKMVILKATDQQTGKLYFTHCEFKNIGIRPVGVFSHLSLVKNSFENKEMPVFRRVSSDKFSRLSECFIVGNQFNGPKLEGPTVLIEGNIFGNNGSLGHGEIRRPPH